MRTQKIIMIKKKNKGAFGGIKTILFLKLRKTYPIPKSLTLE